MSAASTSNKWSLSTGFAFWGVTVQTVFSLIGTFLLMYLIYNAYDLFFSALVPYVGSKDFDYFESVRQKYLDSSIACFVIAALAYIFYLVGICMWKGAQRSIKSDMHVRDIILAEFIMPAEVIIFYMIYKTSPELIENWDSAFPILLCAWAAVIVAVILLLVQFKSLSKEESWSDKARKGADDLRFSYSLVLWIQGTLILGFLLIFLTIYSTISKFQSASIDKFGNTISNTISVAQEMQNVVETIKVIILFVCLIVSIFAFIMTIYRIIGWYKIKVSGNEEVYQFASKQTAYAGSGRFCHKCGMQLPEGSAFCPGCGTPVAVGGSTELSVGKNEESDISETNSEVSDVTVDSEEPSRISIEYEDEATANKKKWLLWGGIAAGIIAIAAVIWAVWGHSDKMEANAKVYADRSFVFKSVEDGVGIEPIDELKYETEVECRKSELDKEGVWTKVAFEKDGKLTFGYMAKADLITPEESLILKKGGMSDNDARRYLPYNIERLALLDALKSSGEGWYLEGINKNGQQQPNFKRLYVKGVAPSETCFGFILRNNETNDRKFFLYSTPDVYSVSNPQKPVFLYFESVKGGDIIYDVNYYHYKKDGSKYEVIYVTNTETDNSDDFLYEGSAFEEEPEEMEKQFGGSVEMIGLVDGKNPVKMELTMHPDHSVTGTVTYTKYNVPMGLTGTYTDRDGSYDLSLDETSDGEVTGNFIGSYDGLVFSGTWVKPDGSKEMPFRVER